MSASPGQDDRLKKENQPEAQRFASMAVDRGAVAVLAHMGLNEGFPEIFPVAEHTLAGLSLGEAYQRTMNAIIGNRPLPAYYDTGAQTKPSDASEDDSAAIEAAIQKDPANNPPPHSLGRPRAGPNAGQSAQSRIAVKPHQPDQRDELQGVDNRG